MMRSVDSERLITRNAISMTHVEKLAAQSESARELAFKTAAYALKAYEEGSAEGFENAIKDAHRAYSLSVEPSGELTRAQLYLNEVTLDEQYKAYVRDVADIARKNRHFVDTAEKFVAAMRSILVVFED